jgi:hypothetical protein
MLLELRLNDILRLRKPHPCGGFEWRVVRLGADIGLEKRTKTIVSRGPEPPPEGPG